jgi:hypothetical protein
MSLRTRLNRLAHRLGTDAPTRAVVYYGPDCRRHDIARAAGNILHLTVPCPRDADPMEFLSPEQRAAIGLVDSVVCDEAVDNPRDRLTFFEFVDDGRDCS